jgi:cytochrome c553
MHRNLLPLVCCAAALGLSSTKAVAADAKPDAAQVEFFEKKIRPVLAETCFSCHGPEKARGGLRLDSRAALLSGGDNGPAIVPGKPEESRLIRAVKHEADVRRMPPKQDLNGEQVAALSAWIKMGAPWPGGGEVRTESKGYKVTDKDRQYWAFQPIKEPALPPVKDKGWVKSPIDSFVLAKLEEKGLRPVAAADKRTLIRRATFDLIGLPPTPEEVDAFLKDDSADAFAKVVDRLLASSQYGERWARHWLDVARYGEDQAHTFEARKYPDGFRYRDWVVKALNDDKPYDRFIMEQIAGDLLDGDDRVLRLAALGFFATGPAYYGKAPADELDDRIDTLSRGFLGLTVACARCHDHKFDPIPTKDYYSLAGIFASTDYKEYILTATGEIDDTAKPEPSKDKKKDPKAPRKPVLHSLVEGAKPANLKVYLRGNPATLGEEATRHSLSVLSRQEPVAFTNGSGRLDLAKSIASKDNPLTARVMVNRLWQHHFGRGLVGTPSNFGSLGERPTHPELLDWLAARFLAKGWSIKAMHREMMLSATYQMSSRHDAADSERDPDNHLLWRMNRVRLEVEPWRDAMLVVAGNLDRTLGGPSIDLQSANNQRRTLYAAISRHNLDPVLRLFDFPDPNLTSDRRMSTNVPSQQLFVLNSDFMVRQAKALSGRLATEAKDDTARIRRAFLLLYGRAATDKEVQLGTRFLAAAAVETNKKSLSPWEQYAQVLLSANEFAFID